MDKQAHTDADEVRTRMWKKMSDSPFVMLALSGSHDHAEPMTAQLDPAANSKFWFYTRRDNRVAKGGAAMAHYASKDHKVFACIKGNLTEETDKAVIDAHWSNITESWFDGGRDDPNMIMLRFDLDDAEIWEGDQSIVGTFKMLTGQKIDKDEAGRHVETAL